MRDRLLVTAAACIAMTTPASAQPMIVADSGDSAWVLSAALLSMIATLPGLALFYGRGRAGPTGFALFVATAIASLAFAVIGYTLIFADGSTLLGSLTNAFLANLSDVLDGTTVSEAVFALFELAFALFAVGILTSSIAERARLGWLLPFVGIWLMFVYVPVARWVWVGWLGDLGTLDYAGGVTVQITAGVAALVVGLLLRSPESHDIQHDSRLAIAGSALIWVGWLGLIGGSALGGGADAATAILNAQIAVSAALITGTFIDQFRSRHVSVYSAANNVLAGLAAVSAGASVIGIAGAIILGALAALICSAASLFVERMKLGGTAAAFTVHGAPAMMGAIVFPALMLPVLGGADFEEGSNMATLLGAQAITVAIVVLWTAVATVIAALMVSMVIPMKQRKTG